MEQARTKIATQFAKSQKIPKKKQRVGSPLWVDPTARLVVLIFATNITMAMTKFWRKVVKINADITPTMVNSEF